MTSSLALRRLVIVGGSAIAVIVIVGAIRLAAAWTASAAPLTVTPVSVSQLRADLAGEQARAAQLTDQLKALDARSNDLEVALQEAQRRITTDAEHAQDLDARLATAKDRLAKVETALDRARSALRATRPRGSATVTARAARPVAEGEHEGEERED